MLMLIGSGIQESFGPWIRDGKNLTLVFSLILFIVSLLFLFANPSLNDVVTSRCEKRESFIQSRPALHYPEFHQETLHFRSSLNLEVYPNLSLFSFHSYFHLFVVKINAALLQLTTLFKQSTASDN
jgi:hypothetical protein